MAVNMQIRDRIKVRNIDSPKLVEEGLVEI